MERVRMERKTLDRVIRNANNRQASNDHVASHIEQHNPDLAMLIKQSLSDRYGQLSGSIKGRKIA